MNAFAQNNIKNPNVAGAFYSSNPAELSAQIDQFFKQASLDPLKDQNVQVLIVPHAGYFYSGGIAAYGFKAVSAQKYKTVVILAPSHYYPFDGFSVWASGGFSTPLGTARVDEGFAKKLVQANEKFYFLPEVFNREHSLEVEIPFVQKTFGDVKIVPVLVGQPRLELVKEFAVTLNRLIGEREDVLFVISSDMSHFYQDAEARQLDKKALSAIEALDPEAYWNQVQTKKFEMCGFVPVTAGIFFANLRGLNYARVLKYGNSADVTGDTSRVVGYCSVIIYKDQKLQDGGGKKITDVVEPLTMLQKKRLIDIAKKTIQSFVTSGKILDFYEEDIRLQEIEGAFVTIHKKGELRGCIGNIIGQRPLYLTVRNMAIAACSQDSRFPPVSVDELNEIDIEVSVLSKPRRVKDANEIQMGIHGVIVSRGFNQGVYLPQVATETGWNREQFLSSLCAHKAGLPADAWKDPRTKLEVFTADVFSEHEF